jgi:outer membrane protein TolC
VWVTVFLAGVSLYSFAQEVITIERALEIAEENNPQMIASKLRLEGTRFSLEAQRATLRPQFSLNLDPFSYSQRRSFDNRLSQWYTNTMYGSAGTFRGSLPILWTDGNISLVNRFGWQDNQSVGVDLDNSNKAFTNSLNLQLDQPIFTYNRQKMRFKELEFDFENAEISYALQRLRTEANITSQFYRVYMAQENLKISRDEYENAQLNYDIIKSKVDADLSAKEELYQAEVNLVKSESSVQQGVVTLDNAKDALKQTLGMSLSQDISVTAAIEVSPLFINPERAIQNGLASRMELRQREILIEEEDLKMITIKALNEFKGDLSLSVGIVGNHEQLSNMYDNPTQSPRVSLTLAIPIFDWGEKKARVKAQQTAQTIAKLEHENQKVTIEIDIRQTLRSLENLTKQMELDDKNVRNAQLTYDLNQIRYREGELTGMQISQFQTQLSTARITRTQTLINYKISLLNLKIASLYDFEKNEAIVPVKDSELSNKK